MTFHIEGVDQVWSICLRNVFRWNKKKPVIERSIRLDGKLSEGSWISIELPPLK